jgi:hypothetical protein
MAATDIPLSTPPSKAQMASTKNLKFAMPLPSPMTQVPRSTSPDRALYHKREESTEEWKARIQRIKVEKSLKKVALERRKSIREKCKKAEEGRRRAWQKTTIIAYFLSDDPRRRKCSDDDRTSEAVSSIFPDALGSTAKTAITLLSFDSNGSNNEKG